MNEETICPYTGLRSFSEDESLYFKGRDGQITRVIQQLEEKKFLMLTGASGDGKSSLIFAGLIPSARAGFFKAKYINWKVVSFRPERAPLKNFAAGLSEALQMEKSIVENELSHGFSSLTEIYKSASTFVDQRDSSFTNASEDERESMGREAGNLLIVVDQFEEFFTNPENFPNGVPSQDARLVLNILLETVKISLRDDLPIYIVFTMRSDYIGQCAAFRGLPEFIGFSQFFVPRLQRRELQEVVEEPAVLSGNRISKRLVDRLIYDLESTEDHLPILQHVLKEMWKSANEGREEIDLMHYAKVGGMPASQLPKEDQKKFEQWEQTLPEVERDFLKEPGISNVLDIHATRLYKQAAANYNADHTEKISEKEARVIIAITFACLTRIDENRAVRNRMTLSEITGIINLPNVTTQVVDDVLRAFREPGNTLVRPFIDENGNNKKLEPNSVLDITHEALIRNWKLLNRWAMKEFEYYNTYLDFKQQLQRWIDNGMSGNYLLPIGPLTYFETWFKESRPNAWWIRRYDLSEASEETKLENAKTTLSQSELFLSKSRSKLFLTRAFIKYGAGRIAIVAAAIVLLVVGCSGGYYWWHQRNQSVVDRMMKEGNELVQSKDASVTIKSLFLFTAERIQTGNLNEVLKDTEDPRDRQKLATYLAWFMFQIDKYELPPLYFKAMTLADSLSDLQPAPNLADAKQTDRYLVDLNDLTNAETDYLHFYADPVMQKRLDKHSKELSRVVFSLLVDGDPATERDKKAMHSAITNSLNNKSLSLDSISLLVTALSPINGNDTAALRFDSLFPADETIQVGYAHSIGHNGGYEMMANIYAVLGEVDKTLQCMDTIRKYAPSYEANENNSSNMLASFIQYGHMDAAQTFVKKYAPKVNVSNTTFIQNFTLRAGVFHSLMSVRAVKNGNFNPNATLLSDEQVDQTYRLFETLVDEEVKDVNERDFKIALMYKQQGSFTSKRMLERRMPVDTQVVNGLFRKGVSLYRKLPLDFLSEQVLTYVPDPTAGYLEQKISRFRLFTYADNFVFYNTALATPLVVYQSDAFFKFMFTENLFQEWYKTQEDYGLLTQWVGHQFFMKGVMAPFTSENRNYFNIPDIDSTTLHTIDSVIQRAGFDRKVENAWIVCMNVQRLLDDNKPDEALKQLDRIDIGRAVFYPRHFYEKVAFDNYRAQTAKKLVKAGLAEQAVPFLTQNARSDGRVVSYAELGLAAVEVGMKDKANAFLDSAKRAVDQVPVVDNAFRSYWDIRTSMLELMILLGEDDSKSIVEITGDMGDTKVTGIGVVVRTYAQMGEYYQAEQAIPSLANAQDRLELFSNLLYEEALKRKPATNDPWKNMDERMTQFKDYVIYPFTIL